MVKKLMNCIDIIMIVIVIDVGREGEFVVCWIIDYVKIKKFLKRLWIFFVMDKVICEGFEYLKLGKVYENLYYFVVVCFEVDWVVGINVMCVLIMKYNV